MFNFLAIAALVEPYLCKSRYEYYPYTPDDPCVGAKDRSSPLVTNS